ncbi:hypothetical protein [Streptomyces sp. NPDC005141]
MPTWRRIAALCTALVTLAGCGNPQGGHQNASRGAGTSDHRTGAAWRYDYTGKNTNAAFADIAAASADDAWAIGKSPVTGWVDIQKTLLFHYDAKTWRPYDLPPPLRHLDDLPCVRLDAAGPHDVWLFAGATTNPGGGRSPLAAHWDGTAWQAVDLPRDFPEVVRDVAVFGPGDVWAVDGSDTAWHWDGRHWQLLRLPGTAQALGGESGRDLWAVGFSLTREQVARPAAMHWDGHTWTKATMPSMPPGPKDDPHDGELTRVVALSAHDVRAFGTVSSEGGDNDAYSAGLALRWDGTRWSEDDGEPWVTGGAGNAIMLTPKRYMTLSGGQERITQPPCLAGRPGRLGEGGCRQKLHLTDYTAVPGTGQVWGVGSVSSRTFPSRPVIVRFTTAP